jgi:endoglucanase
MAAAAARLRLRRYGFFKAVFLGGILLNIAFLPINVSLGVSQAAVAGQTVSAWWPANGAHLTGTQPFKAVADGLDVNSYEMFWQVDGGTWNWMDTNMTDGPHKEAKVDVSGWSWKGAGPYTINFIARQNDAVIAQKSVDVYIDNGQAVLPAPVVASTTPAVSTSTTTTTVSPDPIQTTKKTTSGSLAGFKLWVNPYSQAASQAQAWRSSRPADASKMDYLAAQPTASWFGGWNGDVQSDVAKVVTAAKNSGAAPVLVAYNVPGRDCGGYSAGGTSSRDAYVNWIGAFARGIGSAQAVVILEPDALSGMTCLSAQDQQARTDMLASAVSVLKSGGNTKVYLDAGHSGWVDAGAMAARLQSAGVAKADGFSLDVSNFDATGIETDYGSKLSAALGGKHFVIDTGRNGNGSNGEWCNPWGRATGNKPSTSTGNTLIDAYLWVKTPGESDGACNGGPQAGVWWPDYALSLVK